ncbi:MAG TPA: DUF692 family protein [Steroidobacteraceae bacterium]|nr:DUF692 family protein [Steroidobacteraceae bacterium]
MLENNVTLFDPPMLLDLHNLYANAVNAGCDPQADLAVFPLERLHACICPVACG